MFSGAQISLYPMSDNFVDIILSSLSSLDPYRSRLRIETDDLSTLLVGPPDVLFPAMRDLFIATAKTGKHVTMHATISRGCPGEPDAEMCRPKVKIGTEGSGEGSLERSLNAVADATVTGQEIAAQFSYYPLGPNPSYMTQIYSCIDFIRASGVLEKPKNFCTKLRGDAGKVFATLEQAFLGFAEEEAHIAIDLTVSANSPTKDS